MSYARQMLDTFARTDDVDDDLLAAAIDALSDCAQACDADTAADLSEQNVSEMITCIRLCLDCVDVCTATVGVLSRQTAYDPTVTRPLMEACIAICRNCGDECERHAHHHAHCRVCAEACRRCEQACRDLLHVLR
ncbi:MAG TPA: four-helix bundle copper-binding protein [Streptosporangiaceae bacterium]|nr:four-helix bundle copper-binding protein [Streptosporangiaceae bacterium]